jgi:protein phosphatase
MSTVDARRAARLHRRDKDAVITCFVDEGSVTTASAALRTAVASSLGSGRLVNEDCHSALDCGRPLFVVADGVGGGALAAHASRHLVTSLHDALERGPVDASAVRAALLDADREIDASIARETEGAGAATVALCIATDSSLSRWLVAWVGDCRAYRVPGRHGMPELLTVDDTYACLQERPPHGGSLHDPARMIGNGAVDAPNVRGIALHADEMLVLCSDGLYKHVDAGEIARMLRTDDRLAHSCRRLVELARARGSRDDVTVLVAQRRERVDLTLRGEAVSP